MNQFITDKRLEDTIYDIIRETQETLLIVSPFIKLNDNFKRLFDKHQDNPDIHIILVFGKNEMEIKKSLSEADFAFFKKFPYISIIYIPNLHAKYYGNESKGVVTSINLYDYSFQNNIEFGIYTEQGGLLNRNSNAVDNAAWEECMKIAEENEVVFIRRPVYEHKRNLLLVTQKQYVKSETLFDATENFYHAAKHISKSGKRLADFPEECTMEELSDTRPERTPSTPPQGYCIRTGVAIKFNPQQPMCKEAWLSWNKYQNADFPEKFCHKTGKPSYGKTSMRHPIL